MKKVWPIVVLFIAFAECAFYTSGPALNRSDNGIEQGLVVQIDSLSGLLTGRLLPEAEKREADPEKLRQLFLQSRLAYKKFEWAAEYFNAVTTRTVNGPPVPESQPSGFVQQPGGLQVIEGYVYPKYDPGKRQDIVREVKSLILSCSTYKNYYQHNTIANWQVWDAAKLEVFRVLTLGIAGFDAPLAKSGINESAYSLRSVGQVLANYPYGDQANLKLTINKALNYLETGTGFDNFNRAVFITAYGNPLTAAITQVQQQLNLLPQGRSRRLLSPAAATLFDAGAFDASAFSAYPDDSPTADRIALGQKLFNDPSLSGSGTRSCASCHQADKAFTDGLVKNTILGGQGLLPRNTPTLLNAAFQPAQFADMRETTLEGQARNVIESKTEMHGSLKQIGTMLANNAVYTRLFAAAYPETQRNGIGQREITGAITAYVRTLSLLNSRFDDYMRGNPTAMNAEEVNGFNLFMGKAKCGTCHYMPLFNGALPPSYTKMDAEVIGVPAAPNGNQVDIDPGRNAITHASTDNHAFKIPTVRNAARTAPYMHNGVFATLEEVIDFYNNGGGAGMGIKIDNQTLSRGPLQLTATEKQELVAFIKSLDSR